MTLLVPGIVASAHTDQAVQAVRFDATTEKYTTSTNGFSGNNWTMTCWGKLATDRNTNVAFIGAGLPSGTDYNYLWTNTDGTTLRRETVSSGTNLRAMTVGNWYFMAMSWFSAASDFGYAAATGDASTTETLTATTQGTIIDGQTLYIGNSEFNTWLNGSVAAVKIWTAGLTKTEIDAERSTYAPVRTSNLWAYYTFRNGPQTNDESGNGHTLTATGTLTTDTSGPPIT